MALEQKMKTNLGLQRWVTALMSFGDTKAKPLIKLCCSPNLWGEPELQVSKSLVKEWRTAGPYHIRMNTNTHRAQEMES